MVVFKEERKSPVVWFLSVILAVFIMFAVNYFIYVRYVKENPKQEEFSSEREIKEKNINYKEVEKTLTAPPGAPVKISDKDLKDISAPESNNTEVSKEVLDSLTAPK